MTDTLTPPRHRADVPTSERVAQNAREAAQAMADDQWTNGTAWDDATASALEHVVIAATGSREVTIVVAAGRMARILRMPKAYAYGAASTLASSIADQAGAPFDTALNTDNGKGTVRLTW